MSKDKKPQTNKRPVFIHGLWRCGSTYVWSKFRVTQNTYCFYEPLHQGLGKLTRKRIKRDTPEMIEDNGHPALAAPYFAEFHGIIRKFIKRRGVRKFKNRFAFHNYILEVNKKDRALRNYLSFLTAFGLKRKKQAVLGFNRSGLRLGWMKENIPEAYHIHIDRDPLDIWESYNTQKEKGNYTFFICWLKIYDFNRYHDLFRPFCETLPLRKSFWKNPKSYYRETLETMSYEDTYRLVFFGWLTATLHALGRADLIIDMENTNHYGYSHEIESATGLRVDFEDMRTRKEGRKTFGHTAIEKEILSLIDKNNPLFDLDAIRKAMAALTDRKQKIISNWLEL